MRKDWALKFLRSLLFTITLLIFAGFSNAFIINECGTIIGPGEFFLTSSLNSSNTCLEINSANVTLNCDFFTINGSNSGSGIAINENNVEISNCKISNYMHGVSINGSDIVIEKSKIVNNDIGISIIKTANSTLTSNHIDNTVNINNTINGNVSAKNNFWNSLSI